MQQNPTPFSHKDPIDRNFLQFVAWDLVLQQKFWKKMRPKGLHQSTLFSFRSICWTQHAPLRWLQGTWSRHFAALLEIGFHSHPAGSSPNPETNGMKSKSRIPTRTYHNIYNCTHLKHSIFLLGPNCSEFQIIWIAKILWSAAKLHGAHAGHVRESGENL